MSTVRLSVVFECEIEVDNDSSEDVQIQDAKDAMSYILPFSLDSQDFVDCTIIDTSEPTCERIDFY